MKIADGAGRGRAVRLAPVLLHNAGKPSDSPSREKGQLIPKPAIMGGQTGEDVVELLLSTRTVPGCAIVEVTGEVDISSERHLREYLARVADTQPPVLVVDLDKVGFLDSTGLGMLIATFKRVQADGGRLCLAAPQTPVRKLLRMTALDRVIDVFDSVQAAEASSATP